MVPLLCWKLTAADAGRIATSAAATEMQSSAALMPHLQMKHSVLFIEWSTSLETLVPYYACS